jgi:hypothetical protein
MACMPAVPASTALEFHEDFFGIPEREIMQPK